jgi:cyclophilin family peptidyl-prolyl cis-trans isomerase/PKD repeat protein
MKIMKLKYLFVAMLLLSSASVQLTCSEKSITGAFTKKTIGLYTHEDLSKRMFLFGRIQTILSNDTYSTIQAMNLRIMFFKPFQFLHYTNGEQITFLKQDVKGILTKSFIVGGFTVLLPFNTHSIAIINTTMGTILLELYEDKMPNTTANFIRLAQDGFYDGLVFHRVIDNFVIQGGGYYPNGTEKISPYGPIDLEINPDVHHLDGTIGMARTSDPNSATSQFFIDDGAQRYLEPGGVDPNGYAAFGRVVKGIEVVRAIAKVQTTTKYGTMEDWPVEDIIINQVTIISPAAITITDYVNDVCSIDSMTGEATIITNSTEINIQNLDIYTATYQQQGIQATLFLHVVGAIENRGELIDPYDGNMTNDFDTVEYAFQVSTSIQDYMISYVNKTGHLVNNSMQKNLTSDDFVVVGDTLSFSFYLLTPEEQLESFSTTSIYIKANFSEPTPTLLYFSDIAPNPPLSVTISVPPIGYVDEPVQFQAYVDPLTGLPPYTHLWEFGDEETSPDLNPTHTYTEPGVYTYTLTATDSIQATANASGTITILSGQ